MSGKKNNAQKLLMPIIGMVLILTLSDCASNDPVSPESEVSPLQFRIDVQPPSSLRTADTWNYWTIPVSVFFQLEPTTSAADEGHAHSVGTHIPVVSLAKTSDEASSQNEGASEVYSGSIAISGMQIQVDITDATDLYEMHHDGEMQTHHATAGAHMIQVLVLDNATGHHAHGGITVSHCELSLIAESATDTVEVELKSVQGHHGYRYEANAALPQGTYDLHLEIEPPHFMRTAETQNRWTEHFEAEFTGFNFDNSYNEGSIGETVLVGPNGDSLKVSLRGGTVKTYGAVGMGTLPMNGDENINFSVRLQDPTIHSPGQILYDAGVNVAIEQPASGNLTASAFKPVFGHHGFYFGENVDVQLAGVSTSSDDEHGH